MTVREFLAEQTRLADAATPGPWEFHQDDGSPLDISEVCIPRPDEEMPLSIASLLEDHDGAFIAASRTSVPRMVKALEAVLVLHRPWNRGRDVVCSHCKRNTSPMPEPEHWPCPTVLAITAALEGEHE